MLGETGRAEAHAVIPNRRSLHDKDRFGLSWQIVPRALLEALADPDRAAAKRAMGAMMGMTRIDIAAIERARAGKPAG